MAETTPVQLIPQPSTPPPVLRGGTSRGRGHLAPRNLAPDFAAVSPPLKESDDEDDAVVPCWHTTSEEEPNSPGHEAFYTSSY